MKRFNVRNLLGQIRNLNGAMDMEHKELPLDMERVRRVRSQLEQPDTRDYALLTLGNWIVLTCDIFGAEPATCFAVAAEFVRGVSKSWEK